MKNKYFVNGHTYPDSLDPSLKDSIHDTLFPSVLKGCYYWGKKSQRLFYRTYKRISYKIFDKNILWIHRVELFRYWIMKWASRRHNFLEESFPGRPMYTTLANKVTTKFLQASQPILTGERWGWTEIILDLRRMSNQFHYITQGIYCLFSYFWTSLMLS